MSDTLDQRFRLPIPAMASDMAPIRRNPIGPLNDISHFPIPINTVPCLRTPRKRAGLLIGASRYSSEGDIRMSYENLGAMSTAECGRPFPTRCGPLTLPKAAGQLTRPNALVG